LLRTGIKTGQTRSQIIPVYTNDDQHALKVSDHLFKEKIFVQAIRPPTVENSLLRITLSALHSKRDIDKLIEGIRNGW
jgi:8-amino-7-oxononanoate synthase